MMLYVAVTTVRDGVDTGQAQSGQDSDSGESEFNAANRLIISASGDRIAHGNSEIATEIAQEYSDLMKKMTDEFFTGGKQRAVSLTQGKFLTYCRLNPDSCALLVHVPQLRQYKGDVRDTLSEIAWTAARAIAMQHEVADDATLAVGLRGTILYGPVMVNSISAEATGSNLNSDALHRFFRDTPEPDEADAEIDEAGDDSETTDDAGSESPSNSETAETPAEGQPATTDGEDAAPPEENGDPDASATDKAADSPEQDEASSEQPATGNQPEGTESAGFRRGTGNSCLAV